MKVYMAAVENKKTGKNLLYIEFFKTKEILMEKVNVALKGINTKLKDVNVKITHTWLY